MQRIDSFFSSHFFALIRFGMVGAATALIYFFVMWVAESIFGTHYIVAVSIAYLFSTVFHFFANRHFTFKAAEDAHWYQIIRYIVLWILNYVITIVIVSVFVKRLSLSPYLGVGVSVILTVLTGYVISRYWVFKNRTKR